MNVINHRNSQRSFDPAYLKILMSSNVTLKFPTHHKKQIPLNTQLSEDHTQLNSTLKKLNIQHSTQHSTLRITTLNTKKKTHSSLSTQHSVECDPALFDNKFIHKANSNESKFEVQQGH